VDDEAAGADVVVTSAAVWVDVEVAAVVIRGNARGTTTSGEANGVRRIAWRRESSSGSCVLSKSDSGEFEGDLGGSGSSGSGVGGRS